jgi:hypothetical protein
MMIEGSRRPKKCGFGSGSATLLPTRKILSAFVGLGDNEQLYIHLGVFVQNHKATTMHRHLWNDRDVTNGKMFPLPGGYANVCDSQDAEEHGYSKRNLGKKQVFNFLQKNLKHKKGLQNGFATL